MLKMLTVIGARPQFVKAAVLSRTIRSLEFRKSFSEILVHTGQHYDENMSEVFFREMRIPAPDVNLGIGGGSHGKMTGEMLAGIEALILERKPDLVLVYGDTNSTLAGALAASKLHVPVAHVEAGLRSWDKAMPEEQNRVLTDHLSTWLLCPTEAAIANLTGEGIGAGAESRGGKASANKPLVANVGDIMLDASLYYRELSSERPEAERIGHKLDLEGQRFRLLTLHRAENTDDPRRLAAIFEALNAASDQPLIFPLHPRTKKRLEAEGIGLASHIKVIDPVGFFDMLELEAGASCIVTDSGGVQKEAYFFRRPCVTLRDSTEWVETVQSGWNHLAGADPRLITRALAAAQPGREDGQPYGRGEAAQAILNCLEASL